MGYTSGGADSTQASTKGGGKMGNEYSKATSPTGDATFLTDLAESLGRESESWRASFYPNQPQEVRRTRSLTANCLIPTADDDFWDSDNPEEELKKGSQSLEDSSGETEGTQHDSECGKHKSRSEAITLIRARTRSRSSASESLPPNNSPNQSIKQPPSSDGQPAHNMVYETASVMDYVAVTKKKKKKSKKKGKRQGTDSANTTKPNFESTKTEETDVKPEPTSDVKEDVATVETQTRELPSSNDPVRISEREIGDISKSTKDAEISQDGELTPTKIDKPSSSHKACSATEGDDPKSQGPPIPKDHESSTNHKEKKDVSANNEDQTTCENATGSLRKEKGKGKEKSTNSVAEPVTEPGTQKDISLNTQPLVIGSQNKDSSEAVETPVTPKVEASKEANPTPAASSSIGESADTAGNNVPSTPPRQRSRKNTICGKDKLPSILEVSSEIYKPNKTEEVPPSPDEPGNTASETQSVFTSTPKSTGTGSTGWATSTTALTPQTTGPSEPSTKGTGRRSSKKRPSKAATTNPTTTKTATSSSQGTTTHAHPPSSSSSSSAQSQKTVRRSKAISTQKPEGFFWQLDSHGFPCAKVNCDSRCNLWDGATVICPRCGPYSEVRYCSKEHLFADVKWHWLNCGKLVFRHPCRDSSIPQSVRDGPQLVPCMHPYDTPERFRQAVHFNMNARKGDYFIFSDWADMVEAGFPDDNVRLRCPSKLVYTIKFNDENEKDRFRRVLAACLFMTLEAHELVDYLFRLIRDKLRAKNANPDLETALKYQMHQEFAVTIQPAITGHRHACETDWDGRNRRNCPDDVCRGEFRRLLGSLGGRGHEHLVDHLEATYWILRAARTTHPEVKDAAARMRGEGFNGVAKEDCRVFCRGDGWDGANSGEMEIEGIND